MFRPSKNKELIKRNAIMEGRKVLWLDEEYKWRAATDLRNTPWYALEVEELFSTLNYSRSDWERDKKKYSKSKHIETKFEKKQ